jgi:hypothetical protein
MNKPATTEKVPFRLLQMPCCKTLICWVNPRLPSHCPECGGFVLQFLRSGEGVLDSRTGWLRIEEEK